MTSTSSAEDIRLFRLPNQDTFFKNQSNGSLPIHNVNSSQNDSIDNVSSTPLSNNPISNISENRKLSESNALNIISPKNNALSLLYQNVNGLNSKNKEFYTNFISQNNDVIAITESNLQDNVYDHEYFDSSYHIFRQDRDLSVTTKESGGGLIIAIKKEHKALMITENNINIPQFQCLWVETKIRYIKLVICLIYIPPPVSYDTLKLFFDKLDEWNVSKYDHLYWVILTRTCYIILTPALTICIILDLSQTVI